MPAVVPGQPRKSRRVVCSASPSETGGVDASTKRANEKSQIHLQEVCPTFAAMNRRGAAVADMPCCWRAPLAVFGVCGVVMFVQDMPRINGSAWR